MKLPLNLFMITFGFSALAKNIDQDLSECIELAQDVSGFAIALRDTLTNVGEKTQVGELSEFLTG